MDSKVHLPVPVPNMSTSMKL